MFESLRREYYMFQGKWVLFNLAVVASSNGIIPFPLTLINSKNPLPTKA
jgi:hypothetical protein